MLWLSLVQLFLICVFIVLLCVDFYYIYKTYNTWQPSNKPYWPTETKYDPNIVTPKQQLSLVTFSYKEGDGLPYCEPMWYAFRYVKSDGSYGGMGPWMTTPVQSGGKQQPCLNNDCSTMCLSSDGHTTTSVPCVPVGEASCPCNRPVVGINSQLDYNVKTGEYYAVIHRQTGVFDPKSEGIIIGILLATASSRSTYSFTDLLYNDNTQYVCDGC